MDTVIISDHMTYTLEEACEIIDDIWNDYGTVEDLPDSGMGDPLYLCQTCKRAFLA